MPEPTILCRLVALEGGGLACEECGRTLPGWTGKPPKAACGKHPAPRPAPAPPAPAYGPGSELKRLLGRIGIKASPTCKCNARARYMDQMGCDWCDQNLDLISNWLQEEASARKLPYSHTAGKLLIQIAVRRARKRMSEADSAPT